MKDRTNLQLLKWKFDFTIQNLETESKLEPSVNKERMKVEVSIRNSETNGGNKT